MIPTSGWETVRKLGQHLQRDSGHLRQKTQSHQLRRRQRDGKLHLVSILVLLNFTCTFGQWIRRRHWSINIYALQTETSENKWHAKLIPYRPSKHVWHGSGVTGNRSAIACDGWTSNGRLNRGLTSSLELYRLLGQDTHSCERQLVVLCIEVTTER